MVHDDLSAKLARAREEVPVHFFFFLFPDCLAYLFLLGRISNTLVQNDKYHVVLGYGETRELLSSLLLFSSSCLCNFRTRLFWVLH